MALCVLSGCLLAREDVGRNAFDDRLIGVFITTEFIDLFDFESFLSENIRDFRGGEINVDGNAQAYQGRLYATQIPRTLIDEETGEAMQTVDFIFEGIDGIMFLVLPIIETTEFEGRGYAIMADDAINNVNIGTNVGDDFRNSTRSGTIHIAQHNKDKVIYLNPVYQRADGSVYLESGSGASLFGDGVIITQSEEASTTITENGKTKTDNISFSISAEIMFAPEKIIILQMDANNSLISQTEYEPDAMPETLALETNTAYLIVETHSRDNAGILNISRKIYDSGDEYIETFFARADGFCVKHQTQITWDITKA